MCEKFKFMQNDFIWKNEDVEKNLQLKCWASGGRNARIYSVDTY